jgi:hypothetical protein
MDTGTIDLASRPRRRHVRQLPWAQRPAAAALLVPRAGSPNSALKPRTSRHPQPVLSRPRSSSGEVHCFRSPEAFRNDPQSLASISKNVRIARRVETPERQPCLRRAIPLDDDRRARHPAACEGLWSAALSRGKPGLGFLRDWSARMRGCEGRDFMGLPATADHRCRIRCRCRAAFMRLPQTAMLPQQRL